ncbi:IclR family transcriptional regulator [Saccharomonospora xinjiangensis]|uniref:Transcriptional regulator n=1 Tax=Saccharomonospora xinjiangensis XJ-54 TaxID=882086 RepID=I0V4H7_9PSEU|nr:helix-turn-helix domain-containing protein [Saccharomonospora xinjiangensis]EID55030.1 transcriptional regulator [Saccharomonospora xinjiangensis XJ-54]
MSPTEGLRESMNTHNGDKQRERSPVSRALQICAALADADEPLRLVDIAERTGFLASTASRTLNELAAGGWVHRDGKGRYFFGPALVKLAHATRLRHESFAELARPAIQDLADRTGLMTNVQTLEAEGSRVLAVARARRYAVVHDFNGELVPAHRAAGGVVQVAALPPARQQSYLDQARRDGGREACEEFARQLEQAARMGTATLAGKVESLLTATAAPVLTPDGQCHGAIAIVGLAHEFVGATLEEGTHAVREAAAAVSRTLSSSGTKPVAADG